MSGFGCWQAKAGEARTATEKYTQNLEQSTQLSKVGLRVIFLSAVNFYQELYAVPSELVWSDPLWTSVIPG